MKKYALILVILSFIFTIFIGCSDSSSVKSEESIASSQDDDSSKDSDTAVEENSASNTNSADNDKSKSETQKKDKISSSVSSEHSTASNQKDEKSKTSKNINTDSKENSSINSKHESNQNTHNKNDDVYTSPLGFSLNFPASWKNLYTVTEDDKSLSVYFKQTHEGNFGQGLLFTIQKKTDDFDEALLDSVGSKRYIVAKDILYVIGGPTDVNFSPESPDFSTFQSMHDQSANVIDSIKIIN